MNGDAKELAEIISHMIDSKNGKSINRTFKRGVVASVSGQYADVYIEGSTTATKGIISLSSYRPAVDDKVMILSIGDTGANLLILGSLDVTQTYGVIHFATPSTGQVVATGTNQLNYNAVTPSTNSVISLVGGSARIDRDGLYQVTANLRSIDAPVPTLHLINYSTNNGSSWSDFILWTPWANSTPVNTFRNHPPISATVELKKGWRIRHMVNTTTASSRFGGNNDALGKYQTSSSLALIR